MFQSLFDDIKKQFQWGNMVTRLVIINVAIFLAVILVQIGFMMVAGWKEQSGFDAFLSYLQLHDNLTFSFTHPWVFFTYMFLHIGIWHILWNMLFLYWFGRIVGDFIGDHRILPIYLLGGLMAALFYLITAPFLYPGGGSTLHGASGSVMAIVAVAGMIAPEYEMRLLIIGNVKLKYIVAVLIVFDLVGIANMNNMGGSFAHLGGLAFGFLYVKMLHSGTDLASPVNNFFLWLDDLFKEQPKKFEDKKVKSKVFVRYKAEKGVKAKGSKAPSQSQNQDDFQSKLDAILDKIKESGFESLSEEEKIFLSEASKK